jgi:hypothetical protein
MSQKIIEAVQSAYQQAIETFVQALTSRLGQMGAGEGSLAAPVHRGRPRKMKIESAPAVPKKRGRPPKAKENVSAPPKKRGRPSQAKAEVVTVSKRRGRPPKSLLKSVD